MWAKARTMKGKKEKAVVEGLATGLPTVWVGGSF